ncbi:MAG: hypothetical protein IK080_05270 [Clostridia bacterium]|nr:hypothetical protein [Clostridia bacterium]
MKTRELNYVPQVDFTALTPALAIGGVWRQTQTKQQPQTVRQIPHGRAA